MYVFEKLFKHQYDKISDKTNIINIFLFSSYFTSNVCKKRTRYNWIKYIKYKYFILKNYLNMSMNDINKVEHTIQIYSYTQRSLLALYKFKNICLFKTKKHLTEPMDLNFNPISELSDSYKIDIIQHKIRYQFSIFDLRRIINTSLSYEYNFFPEPTKIKNPWNNKPFTITNLYNIYFFIKNSNINMSVLFSRFFHSNFSLEHFEIYNQFIIKNYVIENCHLFDEHKKEIYIRSMIDFVNNKYMNSIITIDRHFPVKRLVEVMEKYLKQYLLAMYSYEDDLMIKHTNILIKQLKLFNKQNPSFGRKIICISIKKLYYISRLYYEEKEFFIIPSGTYFPKPDMIMLEQKCYFVGCVYEEVYSTFPIFDKVMSSSKCELKITNISSLIKDYKFNEQQSNIIYNKYYPIIREKIQSSNLNTTPIDTLTIEHSITGINDSNEDTNDINEESSHGNEESSHGNEESSHGNEESSHGNEESSNGNEESSHDNEEVNINMDDTDSNDEYIVTNTIDISNVIILFTEHNINNEHNLDNDYLQSYDLREYTERQTIIRSILELISDISAIQIETGNMEIIDDTYYLDNT